MVELIRKLYKRRHSWETTIPMPLISVLDRTKKWDLLYKFDIGAKKWFLSFSEHKKVKKGEKEGIRRHIYIRGSSFATTLPVAILIGLDLKKAMFAHFEFDAKAKTWLVEVQNE